MTLDLADLAELRARRDHARRAVRALTETKDLGPLFKGVLIEGPKARLRATEAAVRAAELRLAGGPEADVQRALDEAAEAERECEAIVAFWMAGPVAGGAH